MARGDVWAGKGTTGSVADLVARFGEEVRAKLQGPAGAVSSREDSLTAPVEQLLRGMASRQRLKLIVHGQSRVKELGIRPDFAIACGGRTIGHVELKQPDSGAVLLWRRTWQTRCAALQTRHRWGRALTSDKSIDPLCLTRTTTPRSVRNSVERASRHVPNLPLTESRRSALYPRFCCETAGETRGENLQNAPRGELRETGRAPPTTSGKPKKDAGQSPFAAGSKIATHST